MEDPHHPAPIDEGEREHRGECQEHPEPAGAVGPGDRDHGTERACGDGLHERLNRERDGATLELHARRARQSQLPGRLPHAARDVLRDLGHDRCGTVIESTIAAEQRRPRCRRAHDADHPQGSDCAQPPHRGQRRRFPPRADEREHEEHDRDHDEDRDRKSNERAALDGHVRCLEGCWTSAVATQPILVHTGRRLTTPRSSSGSPARTSNATACVDTVVDVLAATVGERAVHVVRAGQQRQVGQPQPERTGRRHSPEVDSGIARARIGEIDARRRAHRDRHRRALHVRTRRERRGRCRRRRRCGPGPTARRRPTS